MVFASKRNNFFYYHYFPIFIRSNNQYPGAFQSILLLLCRIFWPLVFDKKQKSWGNKLNDFKNENAIIRRLCFTFSVYGQCADETISGSGGDC
jgi:hypothetical protein